MPNGYGVTPEGFVKKRLDQIMEELHDSVSEDLGFNTRNNPESFLGVLMTNLADKHAEQWEVEEENYYAKYPSSASGQSLDRAAEYGGTVRDDDARTFYPVTCYGDDGTELPIGTQVASDTIPEHKFTLLSPGLITLSRCNSFIARASGLVDDPKSYTITINGKVYQPAAGTENNQADILAALAVDVSAADIGVVATINDDGHLTVDTCGHANAISVVLSNTMTTTEVSTTIDFGSEEFRNIVLPHGTITKIATSPPGLKRIDNQAGFIAGRVRQKDDALRASYAQRIFNRSRTMLESIESAVLAVQGVRSCRAYQNEPHVYKENMPPHSVEVVVDGDFGDGKAVAAAILTAKSYGIQTCHCCGLEKTEYSEPEFGLATNAPYLIYAPYAHAVDVPDKNGDLQPVLFTEPIPLRCDISVGVSFSNEPLAVNAFDLVEKAIRAEFDKLKPGSSVKPQEWHDTLFKTVSGIAYYDIFITAPEWPERTE